MKDKINFIIAQINPVVGDISGNTERIIDIIVKNRELNSTKIFVFPELALCGYSQFLIIGTEIDWKEDYMGQRFDFTNPLANGTCGCGATFSVS